MRPDDRIAARRRRDHERLAERFAAPREATSTERVRSVAREVQRDVLADSEPVTPAAMIARAQRDFPLMWTRCRQLAPTLQLLPGEVLRRALERGLQAIEEGE